VIRLRVYVYELFAIRLKSQLFEYADILVSSDIQTVIRAVETQANTSESRYEPVPGVDVPLFAEARSMQQRTADCGLGHAAARHND
jgi:hypothetical protein